MTNPISCSPNKPRNLPILSRIHLEAELTC